MSDVLLCVVRGVINVNKFKVWFLPSYQLNVKLKHVYKIMN